jgi:hypothetical protein
VSKSAANDPGDSTTSTAEVIATAPSQRHGLNLKKLVAALVVILILVGGGIYLDKTTINPPRFKTITYNNGLGAKFKLQFYGKYYPSKDYTTSDPTKALHQNQSSYKNGVTGLASKVSVNSNYPLWFAISANSIDPASTSSYPAGQTLPCVSGTAVFTVTNTALKQKILICNSNVVQGRPSYTATFAYRQKLYFVIMTQVASKAQLTNSSDVGLSDYRSDLTTIIQSIKPVN